VEDNASKGQDDKGQINNQHQQPNNNNGIETPRSEQHVGMPGCCPADINDQNKTQLRWSCLR
jgi:hypothetical protein